MDRRKTGYMVRPKNPTEQLERPGSHGTETEVVVNTLTPLRPDQLDAVSKAEPKSKGDMLDSLLYLTRVPSSTGC